MGSGCQDERPTGALLLLLFARCRLPAVAWPVCKTWCSTWLAMSCRAERDTLAVNLKESESEKAELVSALEQAKHTVRGVPGMLL